MWKCQIFMKKEMEDSLFQRDIDFFLGKKKKKMSVGPS